MKRTVLLIAYHFPPSAASGAFRLLGFARHLPKFDWNVAVVAPPGMPWEPSDPQLAEQVPPETLVRSTPYPSDWPKLIRWLAPYAVWLPGARRAAAEVVRDHRPAAVLTSGPPHWVHLLGRFVQKKFRLPWIADFRDPWITSGFLIQLNPLEKRWEWLWERRMIAKADLILHNAPRACSELQAAYPGSAARMTYLTNGYDPESFPVVESTKRGDGPVRIFHAGQLYVGRDPRPLLDAIASIPADDLPAFRLEFLGRTDYEAGADLMADARQRGIESRVLCRPQAPYRQTLGEMCQADILLLMDTPERKIGVPAKLYEYFGAGRPILALGERDGDLASVLQESGVPYRLALPHDVPAIRQAVVELVGDVAAGTLVPPTEQTRRRFSREALAGQLAEHLNRLCAERNPR